MKIRPYFVCLSDTFILGPSIWFEEGRTRIGLCLICFEIGIFIDSERVYSFGCTGCGSIGHAKLDELPPGWVKRYRPDRTYLFLCPKCQKPDIEVIEDYLVTPENQEHAINEIIGQLIRQGDLQEGKHLKEFAHKLLEESDAWGKSELSASLAAYSDGFEAGKAAK